SVQQSAGTSRHQAVPRRRRGERDRVSFPLRPIPPAVEHHQYNRTFLHNVRRIGDFFARESVEIYTGTRSYEPCPKRKFEDFRVGTVGSTAADDYDSATTSSNGRARLFVFTTVIMLPVKRRKEGRQRSRSRSRPRRRARAGLLDRLRSMISPRARS